MIPADTYKTAKWVGSEIAKYLKMKDSSGAVSVLSKFERARKHEEIIEALMTALKVLNANSHRLDFDSRPFAILADEIAQNADKYTPADIRTIGDVVVLSALAVVNWKSKNGGGKE